MKKFILLSLLGISLSSYTLYKASLLDLHHFFGRCSGSNAYCNACSNCSACKNCAENGGSCAVCYTPRTVVKRSASLRTYRPAKSIPSNNVHTLRSGSSSVKRYYVQKSAPDKKRSSGKIINVHEQDSTYSSEETGFTEKTVATFLTETETASEPISASPIIPDEKETFVLEIPENADFVRITAASANLREKFSTKSPILQKLKHGDLLIKLKSVKGWMKVQALDSGEIGYVFGALLK